MKTDQYILAQSRMNSGVIRSNLMSFLTGTSKSKHTWQPIMTVNTTTPSYWLNWRFLICAIWILMAMVIGSIVIWKREDFNKSKRARIENQQEPLYNDEAWRTCLKTIHPAWLLAFRVFGFIVLLSLLVANVAIDGFGIFYFYTQWTFALVTIYFGFGSSFSIYGYCQYRNRDSCASSDGADVDSERGTYVAPILNGNANISSIPKNLGTPEETNVRETAGFWGYAFQIIFQTCAGAVVLTDIVFWTILYPLLSAEHFGLNFLNICMHSFNMVFLLGDTILNGLRFPFFRIAYFILWTATYVIFQWIIHACVSIWWPYPFFDLSPPTAPLWYIGGGLATVPCYGIFALILCLKHFVLSRSFPDSYQCIR